MDTLQRPSSNGHAVIVETLDVRKKPRKRRARAVIATVLALLVVAAGIVVVRARSGAAVSYDTVPVTRGDVVQSVTATGTVNPQNTIAVGTQVSGTISEIDADFNSHVRKGQVLAKLDPTTLQAALDQARAALAQAQAQAQASAANAQGAQNSIGVADETARAGAASAAAAEATARMNEAAVATAESNVTKAQSALALAQQTVSRDTALLAQGYIAQSQFDTDKAALVAAQTGVTSAQSAVQQARLQAAASASSAAATQAQNASQRAQTATTSAQAAGQAATAAASSAAIGIQRAQVQQAEANLAHSVITSPVDGTVVARSVSVGQTVAASLQTPTLFSIAQDLSKMEVDLSVGEPDIGNVRPGESADFTVLAYPNETFHGTVAQVRINPTTTQNVVTYTTVLLVGNKDGRLLPGMTANASIHVAKAANALTVPAAALSYTPSSGAPRTTRRARPSGTAATGSPAPAAAASRGSSPWGATSGTGSAATAGASGVGHLFILRDGTPQRVSVKIDLSNGTQAAVEPLRGTLTAGDAVITGDSGAARAARTQQAGSTNRNPLAGGGAPGGFRGIR